MASLIDLRQIKHGLTMQSDIAALKTSYDAHKVLTDIAGGAAGNYNVNELLTSLKTSLDGLSGGGSGSIDDRLNATKTELTALIDGIKTKPVKDYVKFQATMAQFKDTAVADLIPAELAGKLDANGNYPLYMAVDNTPILGADGQPCLYNVTTGVLTGVPSKVDESVTETVTYIPYTTEELAAMTVKIFPVGTFPLFELPTDYLLDNAERATVAYKQAIDQIVVGLASNKELIDQVKALVGTELVQTQIKTITDALEARLVLAENALVTLKADKLTNGSVAHSIDAAIQLVQAQIDAITGGLSGGIQDAIDTNLAPVLARLDVIEGDDTVEGSIANHVKGLKTFLEASITTVDGKVTAVNTRLTTAEGEIDALQTEVTTLTGTVETNRKQAHNDNLDRINDIALINAVTPVKETFVATEGQVEFILAETPNTSEVEVKVNGILYDENAHYTVNRAEKKITWTYTQAAQGFDMGEGFDVVVKFKKTAEVVPPVHI